MEELVKWLNDRTKEYDADDIFFLVKYYKNVFNIF